MAFLEEFLRSGRAADVILCLVLLETLLLFWRQRGDKRVPVGRWLSPLLAGAALVVALRLALTGGSAELLALMLLGAGVAHLSGFRQRWYS